MNLIFPLKWLHTYIPILPREQIDYLDSPTPYVMGVLSSYVDYEYLRENYPNHIICDVNTSMIYGTPPCTLPSIEEINLRKKIQFIKKPDLYEMEDIRDENNQAGDIFNIEDINPMKSISVNIQNVFFRIFQKTLKDIKKLYIKNNVFDSKSFLDDIYDEETKDFWEKIINTVAFEFFILSFQYLDDSNSLIFKNLSKLENDEKNHVLQNQNFLFTYSMNLQNNINFLIKELENKANIYKNKFNSTIEDVTKAPPGFELRNQNNDNYESINFPTENNIHLENNSNYNNMGFFSFEKYKENLIILKKDYNSVIERVYQYSKKNYFEENQNFSVSNFNVDGNNSRKNSLKGNHNLKSSRNFIGSNSNSRLFSNLIRMDQNSNMINNNNSYLRSRKRNNFSYDFSRNLKNFTHYGVIEESNMEMRQSQLQQSEKNTTNPSHSKQTSDTKKDIKNNLNEVDIAKNLSAGVTKINLNFEKEILGNERNVRTEDVENYKIRKILDLLDDGSKKCLVEPEKNNNLEKNRIKDVSKNNEYEEDNKEINSMKNIKDQNFNKENLIKNKHENYVNHKCYNKENKITNLTNINKFNSNSPTYNFSLENENLLKNDYYYINTAETQNDKLSFGVGNFNLEENLTANHINSLNRSSYKKINSSDKNKFKINKLQSIIESKIDGQKISLANVDDSQKFVGVNSYFYQNINQLNKYKQFQIYGESGFLKFIMDLFEILNTNDLAELSYKSLIITEIKKHSSNINKIHKKMNISIFIKILYNYNHL